MGLYEGKGIHGEVVETIGTRVVSGHYAPGTRLLADPLAIELAVSKTVVREALKVLAAKGMVEPRPKRGTVVRERSDWNLLDPDLIAWRHQGNPSPEFLRDLSEIRFIVEPEAARLAAERRDEQDLASLEDAVEGMADAGEAGERMVAADLSFHRALLLATHNELIAQMEMLIEVGLKVRGQLVHRHGPWRDPVPDHREVLAAVASADSDWAASAMRALLEQAAAEVTKLLDAPVHGTTGRLRRQEDFE